LNLWIVLILVAALAAACGGSPAPSTGGGAEPDDRDAVQDGGGTADQVDWEAVALGDLPDEIAAWVDEQRGQLGVFQQVAGERTYILVSWGEKPTGGYEVVVDDVTAVGEETLRLAITLTAPGNDDVVTDAITYPLAVVAVAPAQYYDLEPHFDGARFLENGSFRIEEPALFTVVGDQVRVAGEARVFEGVFEISVEDGHNVLAHATMQVEGAPAWAPFDVTLELTETPTSPNGVVFIYTHSAADGSIRDAIAVPVSFASWE